MNRLKKMSFSELTNVMWWILQLQDKSEILFDTLQREMQSRMNAMKDEDLLTFLRCFTENSSEFSVRLLKTVISVITKKITQFELKTLVAIVWSFSRLNLQADEQVAPLFIEVKEQVKPKLPELSEKSCAILLWAYSREESPDQTFLEQLKSVIINMKQPRFDNFDLLLIVQASKVFEGSYLREDKDFMSRTTVMLENLESFIKMELKKMNVHEFMTIVSFYLARNIGTKDLVTLFKNQIVEHIDEFDQVQLALLRASLKANTLDDHAYLIETIEGKMKANNKTEEVKLDEEKLRMMIREKLIAMKKQKDKQKQTAKKLGIKETHTESKQKYFDSSVRAEMGDAVQDKPKVTEKDIMKEKVKTLFKQTPKGDPTPVDPEKKLAEIDKLVDDMEEEMQKPVSKPKINLKDYLKSKKDKDIKN